MRKLAWCVAFIVLVALSSPITATPVEPGFEETTVGGFFAPTAIAFLPDGRMLVAELGGGLWVASDGTGRASRLRGTPLATIPVAPTCDFNEYETGILGIAVDPSFAANGFIYLYRTNDHGNACDYPPNGWTNEVIRVTMGPGDTVDLGSLTVLLADILCETGYHNGGGLRIGFDGKLYVSVGDVGNGDFGGGGPGSSTNIYAQDLNALEGKVLRLNLNGSIPADNPHVGQAGRRGEIWASGFRNPFRFGFDPNPPNRLWLGDVGEDDVEELDIVTKGGDYSWPHCEGHLPAGCRETGETAPVHTYMHTADPDPDRAITGGAFAGSLFGAFSGHYFFADWEKGEIYRFVPNASRDGVTGSPVLFVTDAAGPVDVVFGPDGALYYVSFFTGDVRRVGVPGGGDQPLSGKKLLLKGDPKKSLQVQSKDIVAVGLSAEDDPTLEGGSLRVVGNGFDDTYDLPASGWSLIGKPDNRKGYKYKDPGLANGPIASVTITNGKLLKATGKGDGLGHTIGESDPSPVGVELTTGTRRFCMSFGGTATLVPNKQFKAMDATAPGACLGN